MRTQLSHSLQILDESFQLYRSHFVTFTILAALFVVPAILVFLGLMHFFSDTNSVWALLGVLTGMLLIGLLGIYTICSISRAAWSASNRQQAQLLQALSIPPLHLLGVSFFSIVNYLIANIVTSLLFLPVSIFFIFLSVFLGAALSFTNSNNDSSMIFGLIASMLIGFLFLVIMLLSLIVSVGTILALIYSLQGLINAPIRFSDRINHTFAIFFHNFGLNILVFMVAGCLILVLAFSVTIGLSSVLYYPIEALNMGERSSAQLIFFTSLGLAGLVLTPIMPIMAAVLYKHNSYEYEAGELNERFEQLVSRTQREALLQQRV